MEIDYGFNIPLGGLTGTYGTHRIGLTFRFGNSKAVHEAYSEAILENMGEIAEVGTPQFKYQEENLLQLRTKAVGTLVDQAKAAAEAGKFQEAADHIKEATTLAPKDEKLAASYDRLSLIAGY